MGEQLRAALAVPAGATAAQRLDHVERILGRSVFPVVPAILPLPALGFALLAAGRETRGKPGNGALQESCGGCPTT